MGIRVLHLGSFLITGYLYLTTTAPVQSIASKSVEAPFWWFPVAIAEYSCQNRPRFGLALRLFGAVEAQGIATQNAGSFEGPPQHMRTDRYLCKNRRERQLKARDPIKFSKPKCCVTQ